MIELKGFTAEDISSFLCKKLEKMHSTKVYPKTIDVGNSIQGNNITFTYTKTKDSLVDNVVVFDVNEILEEMRKSMPKIKIAAKNNNVQSEEINLESTVNDLGKYVTQILHFSGGNKRTVKGVISSSMKEGTLTKFMVKKGYMVMVNINNVDMIEVFTEK